MGTSITKPATIVVELNDGQAVVAGSVLRGTVYLDVRASSVDCSSLQLVLTGVESTCVHYTTTTGSGKKQKTHHHYARETSYFWTVNVPLKEYSGGVAKGNYEYPFECLVPATLPSSLGVRGSSNCSVKYSAKACLHRPGWLQWDIEAYKEFIMTAAPAPVQCSPMYIEPRFVDVNTCFCYKRGRMLTGGSSANGILSAGDTVRLNYAVQNESTAKIKAIEIVLSEVVRWRARSHRSVSTRKLFESRLSALPEDNQTKLPDSALMATSKKGDKQISLMDDMSQLRKLKDMLDSGSFFIDVAVVPDARNSYAGALISVSHKVTIIVRTSLGTANPEIYHPVTIVQRPAIQSTVPMVASSHIGWEPLEPVELSKQEEVALPSYWEAVQSPLYVVPSNMHSTTRSFVTSEGEAEQTGLDPNLFSIVPMAQVVYGESSVASLVSVLEGCLDPAVEVRRWLESNAADKLLPNDFYQILNAISSSYHQSRVAETLSEHLTQITCASVAEACRGSEEFSRRNVVEALLRRASVVDKENRAVVQQVLSPFQFMCIEHYFQ